MHFVLVGTAAVAAVGFLSAVCKRSKKAPETPELGDPAAKIVLADVPKFITVPGLASSISSYGTKVETFLKIAGLEYTKIPGDTSKSPKGKVPYIEHGDHKVGDSEFIIAYLGRTYAVQAVLPSDPAQAGIAIAVTRMVDEHLEQGLTYYRAIDPEGWEGMKAELRSQLPVPGILFPLAASAIHRFVKKELKQKGLLDHSPDDVLALMRADLQALAGILGDNDYMCGDSPYAVDATVFGILDQILNDGFVGSKLRDALVAHANLVQYVKRIRKQFYGRLD